MVLNAAVQMLREADELKLKISKFKSGTSMLQERSLWTTQQQLQKIYQSVLVLDLDYALDKKVEQDLWNIGFKQQIEALQAISKDRKNPQRSEGQAMLSWVLQAAAGFYLCLLHQICTTFKLDLPFRRRASLLGWVEGWGAGEGTVGARLPPPAAARYICQHCLVHLGDLARYRQQLRVAHTFYRHALVVSAHSGQPYNQLALVAWRRGRRLGALYWHVRSLLVRAPFPPAPANLARTLRAARHSRDMKDLPVLPGLTDDMEPRPAGQAPRLDAHSYVTELLRVLHLIHNLEELDTATTLVTSLNSSLSALVATDSFESMTLIKMACVLIWLVHSTTEDMSIDSTALSESEAVAAALSESLAAAALLALLLPQYTVDVLQKRPLPAIKVWLQWVVSHPRVVRSSAWAARPALWPALAHTLNMLAEVAANTNTNTDCYERVPLSEDEELLGFVPLEEAHATLQFPAQLVALDPENFTQQHILPPSDLSWTCLGSEPELEHRLRARRLVQLGARLAGLAGLPGLPGLPGLAGEHFSYTEEDNRMKFTAASVGGEQLSLALAELTARAGAAGDGGEAGVGGDEGPGRGGDTEREDDSDDEPKCLKPPTVISEADFREKVREKRVGILKPQGSLERAREERALATTQDELEPELNEENKTDMKESRKPRVNIAMAAIMRKQEETNKQVKFVTPPPTPDSIADITDLKDEKPKIIQPKAIKSLANLPLGRKTGGILSLKDKSAGYPHLVNTDPEPTKKVDKEEKKDSKPSQSSQNSQQTYPQKRQEHQPSPNWGPTMPPNPYVEPPRANFQKTYGIQNTGISYNPNYQPNVNNQGIRLPVVNPKEIDVRTAALQKQSSRQDIFQDAPKFGNHAYQISGDKKNFLSDLPPRFANQYRYWQNAQENQFNDNKFRDDKSNPAYNPPPRTGWMNPPQIPEYQQQVPWWKPENAPNFNANFTPMNVQPNYFAPNLPNPYQNVPTYNPMPGQNMGQNKPENVVNQPNYLQTTIGQPQMQTMQSIVPPTNFNSTLSNFSYPPAVGYDSSMYPQFGKLGYQPMQMKMLDKPQVGFQGNKELMDMGGLNFGPNPRDIQHRGFIEPVNNDMAAMKNLEQTGQGMEGVSEASGNTYSLFSGAPENTDWGTAQRHPHQSLWSGPGPSPLERLLEQQKQMKQPPAPQ